MVNVGIESLALQTANHYLSLDSLAALREVDPNQYQRLGQHKMAVFSPDEDIVTLGAGAAQKALKGIDKEQIGLVLFATESGLDHSKAAAVYMHKLLDLPSRCRCIELKQACYSATCGIQMAFPMIQQNPDLKVLLVASDIAKYGLGTGGESSQGGGAIAMVLSASPKICRIDSRSAYFTEEAMDFWRPYYKQEAIVDGRFSCEQYIKLMRRTWADYSAQTGLSLEAHQAFCYHVPVPKLVEQAHRKLMLANGAKGFSAQDAAQAVAPSLCLPGQIGNCYSASLYVALLSMLITDPQDFSDGRIGLYSYGSGSVAEFFGIEVLSGYRDHLDGDSIVAMLAARTELSAEAYEDFYRFEYPTDGSKMTLEKKSSNRYRVSALADHKRLYAHDD